MKHHASGDIATICDMSVTELNALYVKRELSPVEVLYAIRARIDDVNPIVNAIVTHSPIADQQAAEAERKFRTREGTTLLTGIPVTIKDTVWTKSMPTQFGCLAFRDYTPPEDSPSVERLNEDGAIIIGKTAVPELAWVGATHSKLHGVTRNPWDTSKCTSGSSGGSAAALACRIGPISVGSDGGASIRVPAAYCGVIGHHPTYGRVPRWPTKAPYDLLFEGPMARTVEDTAILLDTMSRRDFRDWQALPPPGRSFLDGLRDGITGLKVAYTRDFGFAKLHRDVERNFMSMVEACEELGADVEAAYPLIPDPTELYCHLWMPGKTKTMFDLGDKAAQLDEGHRRQGEYGKRYSAVDYMNALEQRVELARTVNAFMEEYDLILTPTIPDLPWEAGVDYPPGNPLTPPESLRRIALCSLFTILHMPACSIPSGWSAEGLPTGLQIAGKRFDDDKVLRAAYALEAARPWNHRRPKILSQAEKIAGA